MLRSLFSGVSGLKNHQTRMDVIGNNISNVNTTGFKASRVTFADTLSQTMTGAAAATEGKGGTNPKQIGLGSQISAVDMLFTDGSIQNTGKNTDLCLSGSGLFVVKNSNGTYYTRNGAFNFDEQGNYVTSDGSFVQGWTALDGNLDTNGTPGNIQIRSGKTMAAKASTTATYVNNLNSAAPTITSMSYMTSAGDSFSTTSVAVPAATATNPKISNVQITYTNNTVTPPTTSTVAGTAGQTYEMGQADPTGTTAGVISKITYDYTVTVDDPANPGQTTTATIQVDSSKTYTVGDTLSTSLANATVKLASATLGLSDGTKSSVTTGSYTYGNSMPISTNFTIYDSQGGAHAIPVLIEKTAANKWSLSIANSTEETTGTPPVPTGYIIATITEDDGSTTKLRMKKADVEFTETGEYKSGSAVIDLSYSNGNGASDSSIILDLTGLTQYSGSSTINAGADGNAAGTLSSLSVDSAGVISGTYTNGIIQAEGQVAVAQFNNNAGLTKVGGSYYQESNNSGVPNIKTAAKLGVSITPSALEMSNADIADQFSDMIITQRGFQSNSKIITVSDEILETLINMKR